MIQFFIDQWDKNKNILREYFETNSKDNYDTYEKLVKLVLELIINKDNEVYGETVNTKKLKEIDYGQYQGCLIYIFPSDTYQPLANETFYMTVDYGSCSGCDTLLSIIENFDEKPTKNQVKGLMKLCLNLIQNAHRFKEWN